MWDVVCGMTLAAPSRVGGASSGTAWSPLRPRRPKKRSGRLMVVVVVVVIVIVVAVAVVVVV
jgi:hypothetical protein